MISNELFLEHFGFNKIVKQDSPAEADFDKLSCRLNSRLPLNSRSGARLVNESV